MRRLLIVDDDRLFCDAAARYLRFDGVEVLAIHSVAEGRALCANTRFDVVLLDNSLGDGKGLELVPAVLALHDRAKIVLVTSLPSFENAVEALKSGVHDYLSKPIELDELRLVVERALRSAELERVEQVQRHNSQTEREDATVVGSGDSAVRLGRIVARAAAVDAPVLVTGETGTGKSLIAKAIHYGAADRARAFVSVNCAALPESLVESELFGVEKGAYTGAVATRKGLFEIAEGGTLFLDEIAEMPYALQAKLLGVLEEKQVRRVGGTVSRAVEVRVIAATNAEPERAIAEGRLRRDLYYRLNVVHVHVDPLRERREDLPELCAFFLTRLAPGRRVELSPSEMRRLQGYDWPGNVRELRNVLDRAFILRDGGAFEPSRLLYPATKEPAAPAEFLAVDRVGATDCAGGAKRASIVPLEVVEREHILRALDAFGGNNFRTAEALGISLSTLKRRIQAFAQGSQSNSDSRIKMNCSN